MQSEPPAAGLGGKDQRVHCPAVDGLFYTHSLAKDEVSCFERMSTGYR